MTFSQSIPHEDELDFVAVGAHPDDVEIACGGTLAHLSRKGYRVGIIDLTGTMSGSLDTTNSPTLAFSGNTAAVALTLGCSGPGTTVNSLTFDAIIDSISIGVAVDGEATFSANFGIASTATSFAGAVTVSW